MSMNRHDHFEELISASLAGDLSDAERRQLDAHLDSCAACRATLASFADQRRIMAGLRHLAPPRDLGARVRSGIEGGTFGEVPWWRRPVVIFGGLGGGLAAVAGALLAIVLLNGSPDDQVGVDSQSAGPSVSIAGSPSPGPETPIPSATPIGSPAATPALGGPIELTPEPDLYLAYTGPFDNLALTLRDGRTGETLGGLEGTGPPIAAELSPNGQFLAYITQLGESGRSSVQVVHLGAELAPPGVSGLPRLDSTIDAWATVPLGESVLGSEFVEHLEWSPNGRYLAYTLVAPGEGPDVWLFEAGSGEVVRLTSVGTAYAGSWTVARGGTAYLWISTAGAPPNSYLHGFGGTQPDPGDSALAASGDPTQDAVETLEGVFQPVLSPNADWAIYWRGVMARTGDEWAFVEAGAPYLAASRPVGGDVGFEFADERPLFSDVTVDRDAFTSAGIAWGADSDAYAVWNATWTGVPQGAGGEYPNINRVYFSHASDTRGLTEDHAIDEADIPQDYSVVDVKVPTGRHLLITAREPIGGIMEAPRARLILVGRNTGSVPDEVEFVTGPGDGGWFGPAAYDAYWEATAP